MKLQIAKDAHDHCREDDVEEVTEEVQRPVAIFDAVTVGQQVPEGFDAVRIPIDGTIKSNLDWSHSIAAAKEYADRGLRIFWDIDLGLFDRIVHPLDHSGQYQSLLLSLEHFRDTLWTQFRKQSLGLCMYRGAADFDGRIPDMAAAEYLDFLARRLPDTIPRYVLLDASHIDDSLRRAQLLSKERYFHFTLCVKGARGCGGDLGWEQAPLSKGYVGRVPTSEVYQEPVCAICLPPHAVGDAPEVRQLFAKVEQLGIPFRVIPESHLTISWDGLDIIYVAQAHVSPQGKRMLNGFAAAGGTVVEG